MRRVIDQAMLLSYSMILACTVKIDTQLVIAFLLALIYVCLLEYVANLRLQLLFSYFFLVVALFLPICLLFLPNIFYSIRAPKNFQIGLLAFGILAYQVFERQVISNVPTIFLLLFGCLLAIYMADKTAKWSELENILQKTRDDSAELTLLLQDKNRTLREKQDYEIYAATLKERNRIAREIHDNVGHLLSRSILLTGALKTINQTAPLREPINHLDETLNEAMSSIRASVHDLHDDAVDLERTLNEILATFNFCQVSLSYALPNAVPSAIKYNFIAIIKEALNNVMKHSNATQVTLELLEMSDLYQLTIADNGRSTQTSTETNGIGLLNMTERIKNLQGKLTIYRQNGFKILIKVPKNMELKNESTDYR
ncbi:two-component sensor histidine kinase [Lactococcus hodotermopsidis]|uniref:histidine kinase n=1 Tax=Pseudolactococcus hodotermopsidis TaxID=2709157 RepID=A0A6A0BGM3_9LACT|nr:sensor histidine kinase [Lactococcus hodotermopsidis]GFH43421.1 two-component sensor histidine kinase [Lactococcus hodotermopsidis]